MSETKDLTAISGSIKELTVEIEKMRRKASQMEAKMPGLLESLTTNELMDLRSEIKELHMEASGLNKVGISMSTASGNSRFRLLRACAENDELS